MRPLRCVSIAVLGMTGPVACGATTRHEPAPSPVASVSTAASSAPSASASLPPLASSSAPSSPWARRHPPRPLPARGSVPCGDDRCPSSDEHCCIEPDRGLEVCASLGKECPETARMDRQCDGPDDCVLPARCRQVLGAELERLVCTRDDLGPARCVFGAPGGCADGERCLRRPGGFTAECSSKRRPLACGTGTCASDERPFCALADHGRFQCVDASEQRRRIECWSSADCGRGESCCVANTGRNGAFCARRCAIGNLIAPTCTTDPECAAYVRTHPEELDGLAARNPRCLRDPETGLKFCHLLP